MECPGGGSGDSNESLGGWGVPEPCWEPEPTWPQTGILKQNRFYPLGLHHPSDSVAGDLGCCGSLYLLVSWQCGLVPFRVVMANPGAGGFPVISFEMFTRRDLGRQLKSLLSSIGWTCCSLGLQVSARQSFLTDPPATNPGTPGPSLGLGCNSLSLQELHPSFFLLLESCELYVTGASVEPKINSDSFFSAVTLLRIMSRPTQDGTGHPSEYTPP